MKFIGVAGRAGSGKTTVAHAIAEAYYKDRPVYVYGFSHKLKQLVIDYFARPDGHKWVPSDLDKPENKNLKHSCRFIYREILQKIGKFFRDIWPDIWVEAWKSYVETLPDNAVVIVPDVRFPNELKAIHDKNGKVLRLTRVTASVKTIVEEDEDETEAALDDAEIATWASFYNGDVFDMLLWNQNMTIAEQNRAVLETVREWV